MVDEKSFLFACEAGGAIRYLRVAATAPWRVQGSICCRTHVGPLRVPPPTAASHQESIGVGQEIQKVLNLSCWKSCAGSDGGNTPDDIKLRRSSPFAI